MGLIATQVKGSSGNLGWKSNVTCHVANQPQQGNPSNMRHLARSFAASLLIAALLTPPSHAQPFPESGRQKAEETNRKAEEKATDEAYKATLKRTQNVKKTVDPWGNFRTPPSGKWEHKRP